MTAVLSDPSGVLSSFTTIGPLLGGFGVLIWLVWRLFWKVDRRSQFELSMKDKKITAQELELNQERVKRFAAEDSLAVKQAKLSSLETQRMELTLQVSRLRGEIHRLREGDDDD